MSRRNTYKVWTTAQIARMKIVYPLFGARPLIAEFGRSRQAIVARATLLGIQAPVSQAVRRGSRMPSEDEQLRLVGRILYGNDELRMMKAL
jgi:hypothetical protein